MRKKLRAFLAVSLALIYCFSVPAFAVDEKIEATDIVISESDFNALEHSYAEYDSQSTRATGLIAEHVLGIAKSGSNLVITGKTVCTTDVTKCGFKTLTIEYRTSSSGAWTEYTEYTKLYDEDNSYNLGKSVAVTAGYQYRVVGEHYAYAGLFTTETIEAKTDYLQF